MTKANGVMKIEEIILAKPSRLLILFDHGQEDIVSVVADVLGQAYGIVHSLDDVAGRSNEVVIGLANDSIADPEAIRNLGRTVVTTHAIDIEDFRNETLTSLCDYEYLYTAKNFVRRDVARYFGFILGQIQPHEDLSRKTRSTLLATTFPDIRRALPNLDILSVGADCVELRVDLLKDPTENGAASDIASLEYVGEQVMLLRQRTELPLLFTTRSIQENGRFPMDDPMLFYRYLRKALQWGCELIDVELWLPEEIRGQLAAQKRNSKIMSSWHDYSGSFKWSSEEARQIFQNGAAFADIVKMIAIVPSMEGNYELEYFRSTIQSTAANRPLCGLNLGTTGELSSTLNKVLTPVTHPLLPAVAAPGLLSVAEINARLHSMGQTPKLDMYAIGNVRASGQATFLEKCLNELGLRHQLLCVEQLHHDTIEPIIKQSTFGGAYFSPPLPVSSPSLPSMTEAAATTGQIDTVVVRHGSDGRSLICDNATWKGIRKTLTKDFVPSAYKRRPALILANAASQAFAAIYALASLHVGRIYTIGFKCKSPSNVDIQRFRGVEDMKKVEEPFVIISALPSEKSFVVSPLLKHYSSGLHTSQQRGKVFLDLSNGIRGKGDSVAIATDLGYRSYGIAAVNASTMVETLGLLLGFNVGFDFVTLASGRSLYA